MLALKNSTKKQNKLHLSITFSQHHHLSHQGTTSVRQPPELSQRRAIIPRSPTLSVSLSPLFRPSPPHSTAPPARLPHFEPPHYHSSPSTAFSRPPAPPPAPCSSLSPLFPLSSFSRAARLAGCSRRSSSARSAGLVALQPRCPAHRSSNSAL